MLVKIIIVNKLFKCFLYAYRKLIASLSQAYRKLIASLSQAYRKLIASLSQAYPKTRIFATYIPIRISTIPE